MSDVSNLQLGFSKIYQFLSTKENWFEEADATEKQDGVLLKTEFQKYMETANFSWDDTTGSGLSKEDLISKFFDNLDTNRCKKINGTNFSNNKALDSNEIKNAQFRIDAYAKLSEFIKNANLQAPTALSSDSSGWKNSIKDSLVNTVEEFLKKKSTSLTELETMLNNALPLAVAKTTSDYLALAYIDTKEVADKLNQCDYIYNDSELSALIDNYIQGLTIKNEWKNEDGTINYDKMYKDIEGEVKQIIDDYIHTAFLESDDMANYENKNAPLNKIQLSRIKKELQSSFENYCNSNKEEYEAYTKYYSTAFDEYVAEAYADKTQGEFPALIDSIKNNFESNFTSSAAYQKLRNSINASKLLTSGQIADYLTNPQSVLGSVQSGTASPSYTSRDMVTDISGITEGENKYGDWTPIPIGGQRPPVTPPDFEGEIEGGDQTPPPPPAEKQKTTPTTYYESLAQIIKGYGNDVPDFLSEIIQDALNKAIEGDFNDENGVLDAEKLMEYVVDKINENMDKFYPDGIGKESLDVIYSMYTTLVSRAENSDSPLEGVKKAAIKYCAAIASKGTAFQTAIQSIFDTADYESVINKAQSKSQIEEKINALKTAVAKLGDASNLKAAVNFWGELGSTVTVHQGNTVNYNLNQSFTDKAGSNVYVEPSRITYTVNPSNIISVDKNTGTLSVNGTNSARVYVCVLVDGVKVAEKEIIVEVDSYYKNKEDLMNLLSSDKANVTDEAWYYSYGANKGEINNQNIKDMYDENAVILLRYDKHCGGENYGAHMNKAMDILQRTMNSFKKVMCSLEGINSEKMTKAIDYVYNNYKTSYMADERRVKNDHMDKGTPEKSFPYSAEQVNSWDSDGPVVLWDTDDSDSFCTVIRVRPMIDAILNKYLELMS